MVLKRDRVSISSMSFRSPAVKYAEFEAAVLFGVFDLLSFS